MKGMGGNAERDLFFRKILRLLRRAKIPFLIGGGYAFSTYTGIRRDTKDLDLFVKPEDSAATLALGAAAGYRAWVKSPHWLGKIEDGDYFVDVIYSSGNGACPVDDEWFFHSVPATLFGVHLALIPPEEMIWSKAFIMERHRYDGADIAHLLRSKASDIDWERLIDRFGDNWPVLLSHLILFRFVYPQNAHEIPSRALASLLDRLPASARAEPPERGPRQCQGTLLSFLEYLPDIHRWGYRDARLKPEGSMSQREIDRWTAERK